jgi:hypothetical protein
MRDLVDDWLLGGLALSFGFAVLFGRGYSYWLKGRLDKFQPDYFRVVDLTGGILLFMGGLVLIVKAIVGPE